MAESTQFSTTNYESPPSSHSQSEDSEGGGDDNNNNNDQKYSPKPAVEFSEDELTLITRMFNLVGKRWSIIAGRIPGRSADEIEEYWTSRN